jgi:hypothetical protein
MASSSVKAEDRLEGASNFNAWKCKILNILEESDLDELVTRVIEEPLQILVGHHTRRDKPKLKESFFTQLRTA